MTKNLFAIFVLSRQLLKATRMGTLLWSWCSRGITCSICIPGVSSLKAGSAKMETINGRSFCTSRKSGVQMPVADPAALPSPAQCHRQGPALNWPAGCGDRDPQRHVHHCGSNKTLNTGSSEINAFLVQVSAFSFCRINTCVHVTHAGLQLADGGDRTGWGRRSVQMQGLLGQSEVPCRRAFPPSLSSECWVVETLCSPLALFPSLPYSLCSSCLFISTFVRSLQAAIQFSGAVSQTALISDTDSKFGGVPKTTFKWKF